MKMVAGMMEVMEADQPTLEAGTAELAHPANM
jgi:hypothetical protein